MPEVLVVGEALVDVVVDVDGLRTERPGGSPANVAVGLHRLGREVQLLTALGADEHAGLLREHLAGIDLLVAPVPRTGTAVAVLDEVGRATYAFEIDWDLGGLRPPALPGWLHVGSLGAGLQPGADAVLELTRAACSEGVDVSFDPNCRPDVTERDLGRVDDLAALSSVVKLSDEDLAFLYPDRPFAEVADRWLHSRTRLVVLTRGSLGATARTADRSWEVPPEDGRAVVDTVGAGDAFMAGLLDGLLRGLPDEAALTHASVVARRTCQRAGADPPWARDLL
ncbi:MAG: hypothetical protein JWN31_1254 [Frankiales bacterium]|nr:hypothetical protein [Frankiales bacterium]